MNDDNALDILLPALSTLATEQRMDGPQAARWGFGLALDLLGAHPEYVAALAAASAAQQSPDLARLGRAVLDGLVHANPIEAAR